MQTFKQIFTTNVVLFSKFCAGEFPWISYRNNLKMQRHHLLHSEDSFQCQVSHTYLHALRVDGRKIRVDFSAVTGSHHDHTDR